MRSSLFTSARWIIAVAVAATFIVRRAIADDRPYAPLDSEIRRVESGGTWQVGDRRGRYRAVVRTRCSSEHCYDDLFLEWVEHLVDEEAHAFQSKVVSVKRVDEVGGLTNVSSLRFVLSPRATRLEVQHSFDGDESWTFCLDLGAPGMFTVRPGTCRSANSPRSSPRR